MIVFFWECAYPAEDKYDDIKKNFCKELQHVFDQFLKCHMKNITPVMRVEFISFRIWYKVLSNCWYDIIVLNVNV